MSGLKLINTLKKLIILNKKLITPQSPLHHLLLFQQSDDIISDFVALFDAYFDGVAKVNASVEPGNGRFVRSL